MKVREVVRGWPQSVFNVMRYLFAFLNHLSEFSDENLMDPYNLAICFGPTLVPIPEERDQVQFQGLVNELIKNFIVFHEDIFPAGLFPGPQYEKYQSQDDEPEVIALDEEVTSVSASARELDEVDDSEVTEDGNDFKLDIINLCYSQLLQT